MRLRCLLTAMLLLLGASPAAAQELPGIEPGRVSTAAVRLEPLRRPGIAAARFTVEAAPEVRLVGPRAGAIDWEDQDALLLPLTFSLAADHPAGPLTVARVVVHWPDQARDTTELRVSVAARNRIAAALQLDREAVAPGRPVTLRYTVHNHGNAMDTVRLSVSASGGWEVRAPTRPQPVARGDSLMGSITLVAPRAARAGSAHPVRLTAEGRGNTAQVRGELRVSSGEEVIPGLSHIPATVFVGVAGPGGSTSAEELWHGVSVEAAGQVAPRTQLALRYRYAPDPLNARVFRGGYSASASGFAAQLRHPAWSLAVGDVSAGSQGIGAVAHTRARGVEAGWRRGQLSGEVLLARPLSYWGTEEPGHLLRGGVRAPTPFGTLGVAVSQTERAARGFHTADPDPPLQRMQSGALTFEAGGGPHRLRAEGGVLRLTAASGEESTGRAYDLAYGYSTRPFALNAGLRHVPAALPGMAGNTGSRASLGGRLRLLEGLNASGRGFVQSRPLLGTDLELRSEGGSAGVRYARRQHWLEVGGNYSESSGSWYSERRALTAGAGLPLGPVTLQGNAEIGETTFGENTRQLERYRAQARWSGRPGRVWLGATYHGGDYGGQALRADMGAALKGQGWEVEGGTGSVLGDELAPWTLRHTWGNLQLDVTRDLALVLGVERRAWLSSQSPWMLGIGVKRRLSLPLPFPRIPLVSGLVYEDLNNNGRRDPGEAGIADVTLLLGRARAATDAAGRFTFSDGAGSGRLQVDVTSLAAGMMVRPDTELPSQGRVEIPVIRTTALRLIVFLDLDGDGIQQAGDRSAAGAVVVLTDSEGRRRSAAADEQGVVNFLGLPSGTYTATVQRVPNLDRPIQPRSVEITVAPGEGIVREIPVPWRPREIRMRVITSEAEQEVQ